MFAATARHPGLACRGKTTSSQASSLSHPSETATWQPNPPPSGPGFCYSFSPGGTSLVGQTGPAVGSRPTASITASRDDEPASRRTPADAAVLFLHGCPPRCAPPACAWPARPSDDAQSFSVSRGAPSTTPSSKTSTPSSPRPPPASTPPRRRAARRGPRSPAASARRPAAVSRTRSSSPRGRPVPMRSATAPPWPRAWIPTTPRRPCGRPSANGTVSGSSTSG